MSTDYDIAVVGGGLAGVSLACALSDTGLRIALIEAVDLEAPPDPNMKARNIALAWGTRVMFERLGLWATMADDATPIEQLHVSQAGHFGRVMVSAAEYDLPALGYVLPNLSMINALRRHLPNLDSVDTIAPARFESLEYTDDDAVSLRLETEDGQRHLSTRLLIGADGTHSKVRRALGIGARFDDYEQSAVVSRIRPEISLNGCAHERFTPDGPIAVLPFIEGTAALVWTVPTQRARQLLEMDDETFITELQAHFGTRLGALASAGPRGSFPLARMLCDRAWSHRAALIGNAGHSLHPSAAQGFNLAIRDALGLAARLREQQQLCGQAFDPGADDWLAAWADGRRPDQHRVANFTDRIVRVFSNRIPGLGHARGAGLFGLSLAPGIRRDMAYRSMGMALLDDINNYSQGQS